MKRTAVALTESENFVREENVETEDIQALRQIWRNRRDIKASLSQASLFRYLFFERKSIRYFGNVTHIFFPKIFPPGIQLSRDVGVAFTKYLQPWSNELLRTLDYTLKTGWPYVTKKEYNLIAITKKLCEKIASTDFSLLDPSDRNLIDKLRSLEILFLVLHYRPEHPDTILSSLQRVLKKDLNHTKDAIQDVTLLVKRIVNKGDGLPSLYNFLLGLNMLKYRRYFELQDLIDHTAGEMVSTEVFECEKHTQEEIDLHIEDCQRELVSLHKRKLEIHKIKTYLPKDESGQIDYKTLEYFYESNEPKKNFSFVNDQENMLLFATRFFGTFVSSFENILNGKIHLSGVGNVELFAHNFFQIEFTKLHTIVDKLEKSSYHIQLPFSYSQYLLFRSHGKAISQTEVEAVELLDNGLSILCDLGKKIDSILRSRAPVLGESEPHNPLEMTSLKERSFILPYEEKIIKFKTKLGGKRVVEALSFTVSVCYLAGMFFQKPNIYDLVCEEEKVDGEFRSKLEVLERIANPKVYRELRERYLL